MTPKQVKNAAAKYYQQLADFGFAPIRQPDDGPGGLNALTHTMWMCEQLVYGMADKDMEKACRWLGFIQGVLWVSGTYTIYEMKEHNR